MSELAKKGIGYRKGKTAALQRAGVSLLKIIRFAPKTISKCKLACKIYFNPCVSSSSNSSLVVNLQNVFKPTVGIKKGGLVRERNR